MTIENIDKAAHDVGLTDITVVKHYTHALPNGKEHWGYWHRIIPEQFETYLNEVKSYKSKYGINIRTGVETELVNEGGDINIPDDDISKIDMITLSVHYMPDLFCIKKPLKEYPPVIKKEERDIVLNEWQETVKSAGVENIVEGLVNAYISAIKRNPKVRVMAHMYDGLLPLRTYHMDVNSIPSKKLVELFEPLMKVASEYNVLWELSKPDNLPIVVDILKRANESGVRFTATSDSHSLSGGWGNICDHDKAEEYIKSLGLNRGKLN